MFYLHLIFKVYFHSVTVFCCHKFQKPENPLTSDSSPEGDKDLKYGLSWQHQLKTSSIIHGHSWDLVVRL